jgi:hypothetical protein
MFENVNDAIKHKKGKSEKCGISHLKLLVRDNRPEWGKTEGDIVGRTMVAKICP